MSQISTNEFKAGVKVEYDGNPYVIVFNEFVKPGKGQAFNRVKLKHLVSGKVVEKTFKSGEKVELADVCEKTMRMLYQDNSNVVFMDDQTFEQVEIPNNQIKDVQQWLKEEICYEVIFYRGNPINIIPPIFMELKISEAMPGERGDTTGRVLKPAKTETGGQIQIPIFIQEGEIVKIDTRVGEYVSRVNK